MTIGFPPLPSSIGPSFHTSHRSFWYPFRIPPLFVAGSCSLTDLEAEYGPISDATRRCQGCPRGIGGVEERGRSANTLDVDSTWQFPACTIRRSCFVRERKPRPTRKMSETGEAAICCCLLRGTGLPEWRYSRLCHDCPLISQGRGPEAAPVSKALTIKQTPRQAGRRWSLT